MTKDALLNPETLKNQDSLSEDQQDALHSKMAEELYGIKDDSDVEIEEVGDKKDEKPSEDKKSDDSKEKTDETASDKEDEESDTQKDKTPEEEGDSEVEDKEDKEQDKKEDKSDKSKSEDDTESRVKEAVDEFGMSDDEARDYVSHIDRITKKYEGNPKKMASAILSLHRMHQKTLNDLETSKKLSADETIHPETKQVVKKEALKSEMISKFRGEYPKMTEDWDDERVVEEIKIRVQSYQKEARESQEKSTADSAKAKRIEIVNSLSDSEKKYLSDIKPILEKIPAQELMREDFSIKPLILMARGKSADKEIKDAEERGYKRGLEQAKISDKGQVIPKNSGGSKTKTVSLTDDEKEQALNMYVDLQGSDQDKFAKYQELKDFENKKRKERGF